MHGRRCLALVHRRFSLAQRRLWSLSTLLILVLIVALRCSSLANPTIISTTTRAGLLGRTECTLGLCLVLALFFLPGVVPILVDRLQVIRTLFLDVTSQNVAGVVPRHDIAVHVLLAMMSTVQPAKVLGLRNKLGAFWTLLAGVNLIDAHDKVAQRTRLCNGKSDDIPVNNNWIKT